MAKFGQIAGDFAEDIFSGAGDFVEGLGLSKVVAAERVRTNNAIAMQNAQLKEQSNKRKWELIEISVYSVLALFFLIALAIAYSKFK